MNHVRSTQAIATYPPPSSAGLTPLRVLMEAVEARILFSSPSFWQSGDRAVGTLKDLDGNLMGSATLVDGMLTVNGTDAGEEIVLGMAWGDPTKAYVRITRPVNPDTGQRESATFVYDREQLNGIVVNAGDGDDYLDFLSFGRALSLPVTLNGDAGNDTIEGNGVAWDENRNDYVVDTTDVGVVMHGGDGNDTLYSGSGPDVLDGGDGDDLIEVAVADAFRKTIVHGSGNDTLRTCDQNGGYVDSPLDAPAPQPAPPVAASPATAHANDVITPAPAPTGDATPPSPLIWAPPPIANGPSPFGTNTLLASDRKLWEA